MKVEWSSAPMEAGLKCVVVEPGAQFQQASSAYSVVPLDVSQCNFCMHVSSHINSVIFFSIRDKCYQWLL